jgi:plasmid stabilization system protein ParE
VAKVRLSVPAVSDLDRMIITHSLPVDTRLRVQRSLRVLEQFPRIGRPLERRWAPMRVILGQWRWMLIIYSYEEPGDVVLIVVAFQDARSSAAATAS